MTLDHLVRTLFEVWQSASAAGKAPQSVVMLGAPGIGKTSAAMALAARMTAHERTLGATCDAVCEVRDLSSCLPEDIGGLPYRDGGVTRYAPQQWMERLCDPSSYGVLILDDLPAAMAAVQVATRQLVLTHCIHDAKLSPRIMVIVTGNRRQDRSGATALPAHFRNSVMMVPVEADAAEWEQWYVAQGLPAVIPNFIKFRPGFFSQLPADADANGAFATPRSWVALARVLEAANRAGALREVASGLVGEGVANEFLHYSVVHLSLPDIRAVLADPARVVPDPGETMALPDRAVALVQALASAAAEDGLGAEPVPALAKYLSALAWLTHHSGCEYAAISIDTFTTQQGSVEDLQRAARTLQSNEQVSLMMNRLTAAFGGS